MLKKISEHFTETTVSHYLDVPVNTLVGHIHLLHVNIGIIAVFTG